MQPSRQPTCQPSTQPSSQPTSQPSTQPTTQPSKQPSSQPTTQPSAQPSVQPTTQPSAQPSSVPTSHPSFIPDPEIPFIHDKRRYRQPGKCANNCNGHGTCKYQSDRCDCFKDLNGDEEWTGVDCSLRACPK